MTEILLEAPLLPTRSRSGRNFGLMKIIQVEMDGFVPVLVRVHQRTCIEDLLSSGHDGDCTAVTVYLHAIGFVFATCTSIF